MKKTFMYVCLALALSFVFSVYAEDAEYREEKNAIISRKFLNFLEEKMTGERVPEKRLYTVLKRLNDKQKSGLKRNVLENGLKYIDARRLLVCKDTNCSDFKEISSKNTQRGIYNSQQYSIKNNTKQQKEIQKNGAKTDTGFDVRREERQVEVWRICSISQKDICIEILDTKVSPGKYRRLEWYPLGGTGFSDPCDIHMVSEAIYGYPEKILMMSPIADQRKLCNYYTDNTDYFIENSKGSLLIKVSGLHEGNSFERSIYRLFVYTVLRDIYIR